MLEIVPKYASFLFVVKNPKVDSCVYNVEAQFVEILPVFTRDLGNKIPGQLIVLFF